MAKLPQGILGPLVGTAGPVTGYLRLGIPVLRSLPRTNTYQRTAARTAQQQKLQAVLPFIKAFTGTGFFKMSFPVGAEGSTGYNRALSQAMSSALVASAGGWELSYPLVQISRGSLPPAQEPTVTVKPEGYLQFRWVDNSATGKAKASDPVLLVAYFPELGQAICSIGPGNRGKGEAVLPTPNRRGYKVETWMGFINEAGTDAADSVYMGSYTI